MKIQEEFYNAEIGRTYYNQYFITETMKPLNAKDYFLLKEHIDEVLQFLMDNQEIELKIIVKSE